MKWSEKSIKMFPAAEALAGRAERMQVSERHFVTGNPLRPPFPEGLRTALFAMGCFWGAERRMWEIPGVFSTAAGYTGGSTPNPTYEEVCSGRTGHAESVLVVYDPGKVTFTELLKVFWESHDPTQGMRQGNDVGTQYRSAIYFADDTQCEVAEKSKAIYNASLDFAELGSITTDILPAGDFFYAEDDHQQYLAKNPTGYCGLGGTGIAYEPD